MRTVPSSAVMCACCKVVPGLAEDAGAATRSNRFVTGLDAAFTVFSVNSGNAKRAPPAIAIRIVMMMRKTLRYVNVFHAIWICDLRLDRTQCSSKRGISNYVVIIIEECGADGRNV